MIWYVFFAVIAVSILGEFIRLVKGETKFDRILAANLIGTNVIVLICLIAFASDAKSYIDIALVYAFLNFIGTIAFLKFFKKPE